MRRAPAFRLIESSPRPWRRALLREGLGAAVVLVTVGGTVAVQGWRPEWGRLPNGEREIARFLAPIVSRSAPPPREERVAFVGLGGFGAAPPTSPAGDSRRATAVHPGQPRGEALVVPTASDQEPLRAYTDVEVDSVAILDPNGEAPVYPPNLLKLGIEGVVLASFVVDSTGRADVNTFVLLQEADPEFVAAVKSALTRMRYRPAMFGGKRVNQLAEQRFAFRLAPKPPVPPVTPG